MCLECGHYDGRQVMDLKAVKDKRDARIQAKKERISAEAGAAPSEAEEVAAEADAPQIKEEKEEKNEEDTK